MEKLKAQIEKEITRMKWELEEMSCDSSAKSHKEHMLEMDKITLREFYIEAYEEVLEMIEDIQNEQKWHFTTPYKAITQH